MLKSLLQIFQSIQHPTLHLGIQSSKEAPYIETDFEVYYFDVGQADSVLIRQNEHTMLIDAGNNKDGSKIVKYLKNNLNINSFEYVIGTHSDEDHIGGIDNIINNFSIDTFYMPYESQYKTKSIQDVKKASESHNLEVINPNIGTSFKLGDATCEIVHVDNNSPEENNNSSIVLKITYKEQTYLFPGDAEYDVESQLDIGKINVYMAGHHGSKSSSTADFIKRIDPDFAIISVGPNNDYNLPSSRVTNRLNEVCDRVYRTDVDGTIHLISDGKTNYFECLSDVCLDGNDR